MTIDEESQIPTPEEIISDLTLVLLPNLVFLGQKLLAF